MECRQPWHSGSISGMQHILLFRLFTTDQEQQSLRILINHTHKEVTELLFCSDRVIKVLGYDEFSLLIFRNL